MPASRFMTLAAAALLTTGLAVPVAADQQIEPPAADLIEDAPGIATTVLGTAGSVVSWTWGYVKSGVGLITPPSPTELARMHAKDGASEMSKLLDIAGYKMKEIGTDVGLIPSIAFKFGIVRELSEADIDYVRFELERSRDLQPGPYAGLQRAIVNTVLAINAGGTYRVSELKVQVLPLPKAEFSVTPTTGVLGEDSSTLLRAIQRVDRNVLTTGRAQAAPPISASITMVPPDRQAAARAEEKTSPLHWSQQRYLGVELGEWSLAGAVLLILAALLFDAFRRLRRQTVAPVSAVSHVLFAIAGVVMAILGWTSGYWLFLVCSVALFVAALVTLFIPVRSEATATTTS